MNDELQDQEPDPSESGDTSPPASPVIKSPFSNLRPDLSEDELASPGVQRLLHYEVLKLERGHAEMKSLREKYHEADKERAVLQSKVRQTKASDINFAICLTAGGASIGLAPTFWGGPAGWPAIGIGLLLWCGGCAARLVEK